MVRAGGTEFLIPTCQHATEIVLKLIGRQVLYGEHFSSSLEEEEPKETFSPGIQSRQKLVM
jgi:hypothetical protein